MWQKSHPVDNPSTIATYERRRAESLRGPTEPGSGFRAGSTVGVQDLPGLGGYPELLALPVPRRVNELTRMT
jgi:hypothetical protein